MREWVKAFHRERIAGLFPRSRGNRNAAKLTREQKQAVAKVLASPPSALSFTRYSFHLPVRRNRRRDEVKTQRRMAEIKEIITPYWRATNWEILVSDETRLVWEALIRTASMQVRFSRRFAKQYDRVEPRLTSA